MNGEHNTAKKTQLVTEPVSNQERNSRLYTSQAKFVALYDDWPRNGSPSRFLQPYIFLPLMCAEL